MKVLLVGGGGREHALAWRLARDEPGIELIAAPGNPGIAHHARIAEVRTDDVAALAKLAAAEKVDFTLVGPEAPLAAGIVDHFREQGLAVFGPTMAAARIETSKAFAKALMARAGVPTARAETHVTADEARESAARFGAPVVIKASGLAAGKGVTVCMTLDEAETAIARAFGGAFGDAGREVLVEEYMTGEELSLFVITDGTRMIPLVPAQDHKRLRDGDAGPNTGGMGAYAPVSLEADGAPVLPDGPLVQQVLRTIVAPTLEALRAEGCAFTGLLYAGLMLTPDGPRVVEFNCRFGDPETQAVLAVATLRPSLAQLMLAVARGEQLPGDATSGADGAAVTTVVAAPGYPDAVDAGGAVTLPHIEDAGVVVFHAGTRRQETGELVAAGGRVLAVTALASTFTEAQELSIRYAAEVGLEGAQRRGDIGWRELARQPGS